MKNLLKASMGVLSFGFSTFAASAHPHVFAEARLEVKSTPDGFIETLRHVWRFDELFTSTVVLEFDADQNGTLDDTELENVANTVASSIADFDYFQSIAVAGHEIYVKKVTEMTQRSIMGSYS